VAESLASAPAAEEAATGTLLNAKPERRSATARHVSRPGINNLELRAHKTMLNIRN
jgi:hypothetical protein